MFLSKKVAPSFLIVSLFILLSCNDKKDETLAVSNDSTYESNRVKAKELKEIYQKIDPQNVEYHDNHRRADYFKNLASKPNLTMPQKMMAEINVGYELLMAGKNSNAIVELEKSLAKLQSIGTQKKLEHSVRRLIALSYMRIGEQENCINKFNKDACIFPLEGGGVYKMRKGPETAISLYKDILKEYPDDEESKWMLNIAYMALGEYPKSVPAEYLVPPITLESEATFSRFNNIADKVSLSNIGLSGGAIIEDFDNDGKLDIVASSWGYDDQMKIFKNTGFGFEDVTGVSELIGQTSGLNMIHCDFNNDGLKDIFLLRGAWYADNGKIPNSLLQNMGNFKFKDVTKEVGLDQKWPTQTAVWTDINNDGWLDLFIGNESTSKMSAPSEFYLNEGGKFKNISQEVGININGFIKGCTAGDIDNDGDEDIYISYMGRPNQLLRNDSKGGQIKFTDISTISGTEGPIPGFPTWMWDFNNDGYLDILAASYDLKNLNVAGITNRESRGESTEGAKLCLLQNNGNGTFSNISSTAGLDKTLYVMGSNYGDLDNDGFLDMYLATGAPSFTALVPNKLYKNNKGEEFFDVTTSSRTGHLQKGHAVAFGDIDNDGDEDIFHVLGGAFSGDISSDAVFQNTLDGSNKWINLELVGTQSNKAAIGARVKLTAEMNNGKMVELHRHISTGSSFGSNSLNLEFGLGDVSRIVDLEITWPNKSLTVQSFSSIQLNSHLRITEGEENPEYKDVKILSFSDKNNPEI